MRLSRILAIPALVGLAVLAAVVPAGAIDGTTTVTLGLTGGGSLSITPPAAASGSGSTTPGSTVSVAVGATTVVDERGTLAGWTVTAAATDLVTDDGGTGEVIPKANMTWATGTVSASGGGVISGVAPGVGGTFASTVAVAASLPLFGAGTFSYPATVTVAVPANLKAGTYVSTITQTVV